MLGVILTPFGRRVRQDLALTGLVPFKNTGKDIIILCFTALMISGSLVIITGMFMFLFNIIISYSIHIPLK